MSRESRLTAGLLLIPKPAVVYEGASLLSLLVSDPGYTDNQLRQDLWRVGYAPAGVLLVLSLVTLRYVGAVSLAMGLLILGVGMIQSCRAPCDTHGTAQSGRVGR